MPIAFVIVGAEKFTDASVVAGALLDIEIGEVRRHPNYGPVFLWKLIKLTPLDVFAFYEGQTTGQRISSTLEAWLTFPRVNAEPPGDG